MEGKGGNDAIFGVNKGYFEGMGERGKGVGISVYSEGVRDEKKGKWGNKNSDGLGKPSLSVTLSITE